MSRRRRVRVQNAVPKPAEVPASSSDLVLPADRSTWFYPTPLWKILLLGSLGTGLYTLLWSYRNWSAYRKAWGYSKEEFWRTVHARSGYRISAGWRTLLTSWYLFALFPAIDRECRAQGLPSLRFPLTLAAALVVSARLGDIIPGIPSGLAPAVILLPVQLIINRLNGHHGISCRAQLSVGEVLCSVGGILAQLAVRR